LVCLVPCVTVTQVNALEHRFLSFKVLGSEVSAGLHS
jgi:hypothetical protein